MIRTPDAFDNVYSKLNEILEKISEQKHYGFYQLCPKCDGEGQITNYYPTTSAWRTCPVCNGAKLLVRPEIKKEEPGE